MNAAAPPPENGQYSTSQQRPFFYAQPTAQLPFPNPWYLSQLYNPYCIPGPSYRGGNPYFPYYSVALHEYPGFYVPQHQMNVRMSRRPHFNPHPPSPMFYHATRFRHYSSPGRRTETKETQTDPRQPEYITKKHMGTESKDKDAENLVSHSSGISTENENNLENVEMTILPAPVMPERDFHKNSCSPSQYRNMPPGSYAYEKEEVRIEYGSGSPAAIQMWKSYKETIPIYDVAVVKDIPENVVQSDLFCEGVLYSPRAEEEIAVQSVSFSNKEESKQSPSSKLLSLDGVQESETQTLFTQSRESSKQAKQNTKNSVECEPKSVLVDQVKVVQQADDPENSEGNDTSKESDNEEPLIGPDICTEKVSNQSVCNGEVKVTNSSVWAEDSVQKFIPSPAWLACFDNLEANYDYDLYMSQRKQKRPSILSITSEELSSKDEGSSMDSASVYFVPDYMLRKGLYTFRKHAESTEREKIQSSGSLKEDGVPQKHAGSQYEKSYSSSGLKVRDVSSGHRKIGVPVRGLSKRKLYSVKKKPRKSQSLSEPEDSEEYWVVEEENLHDIDDDQSDDDEEYYFQESLPHERLELNKGNYFKQIAQKRILWKPPKGVFPAQLVGFPVREKLKVKKKGASETLGQMHQLKQSDYIAYEKPERGYKEVTEQKKPLQKPTGGKPQKKTSGATVEEYWVGRGAKPKFSEPTYYLQDPAKVKEQDKPPKKKGPLKSSKRKQNRTDTEEIEAWEIPRSFLYRGHSLRKGGTKKK
ncbi:bucky ball-like [Dendropsophus ebraccatus]|uniref:bucky ball-like n=1 Tax=Dendropsophus ebraccatus TaxID=150705 RepID=UPI00383171E5